MEELREEIHIINKPLHMTSHDVIDQVRRKTGERRVGHAGTLDPLASGILIVLVGRGATRRQAEFMGLPKEYIAEVTFGSVSETYDAEGPITQQASTEELQLLTEAQIKEALKQFVGNIQQRPPIHSAIKVGGKALYKKARKGEITAKDVPPREVTIDAIALLDFTPATTSSAATARLKINCQKGVYIRSLAHDLGKAVNTGAYLSGLERTAVGPHTIDTAMTLDEFIQA